MSMISRKIAYIDASSKPIPCVQPRRNRQDAIKRDGVSVDSRGNISHPPIANLACFGNPIEYHRGGSDKRKTYNGVEGPAFWCEGCKSRPACGETVLSRVETDPDLANRLAAWERETRGLAKPTARYEHATFTDFAVACDERSWTSDNDVQLGSLRDAAAKRARKDRDKQKRKVKGARSITLGDHDAIDLERDQRHGLLIAAARAMGAPPRLSKLDEQAIAFTCDVWRALALLDLRYAGKVSGGDVVRLLAGASEYAAKPLASLRRRVSEVTKRVEWLEGDAAVWDGAFKLESEKPPRPRDGVLGGVVWKVLADADL